VHRRRGSRATTPSFTTSWTGYLSGSSQFPSVILNCAYERASLIVTSNKPFSAWGEIFGDEVVAAAMIDRLVHHAEILSLKGDSYRLQGRDLGGRPPAQAAETA